MKATINIQMDNDAFVQHPSAELARILKVLADNIEGQVAGVSCDRVGDMIGCRDINGNSVGRLEIIEEN